MLHFLDVLRNLTLIEVILTFLVIALILFMTRIALAFFNRLEIKKQGIRICKDFDMIKKLEIDRAEKLFRLFDEVPRSEGASNRVNRN